MQQSLEVSSLAHNLVTVMSLQILVKIHISKSFPKTKTDRLKQIN